MFWVWFRNWNKKAHESITIGFNNSGVQLKHRCFPAINAKILKNICERLPKTASGIFFNEFCKIFILRTPFLRDCFWYLIFKLLILNKFVHSINIVDTIFDDLKCRYCFLWSTGSVKLIRKPPVMFSILPFYSWVIIKNNF